MTTYRILPRERFIGLCHWAQGWRRFLPCFMARDSLLMYSHGPVNYSSSCQIVRHRGTAWLDTLNGSGFYDLLASEGMRPFTGLGLRRVLAAVTSEHLVLIHRKLRRLVAIREVGRMRVSEYDLVLIEFTERSGDARD